MSCEELKAQFSPDGLDEILNQAEALLAKKGERVRPGYEGFATRMNAVLNELEVPWSAVLKVMELYSEDVSSKVIGYLEETRALLVGKDRVLSLKHPAATS